eukprot:3746552-Rhodomonas_salina.1
MRHQGLRGRLPTLKTILLHITHLAAHGAAFTGAIGSWTHRPDWLVDPLSGHAVRSGSLTRPRPHCPCPGEAALVGALEVSVLGHWGGGGGDAPEHDGGDEAGGRARDDPAAEDLEEELPVDGVDVAVAQAHAGGGAGEAVRGGDGEAEAREDHDGEHCAELDAEAARGRLQRQPVPERGHDVVPHRDEADVQRDPAEQHDPDRDGSFAAEVAGGVDEPDGGEGREGVGDVVGAVGDGEEEAGRELQALEHLLCQRQRLERARVHLRVLLAQSPDVHVHPRRHFLPHLRVPLVIGRQCGVLHPELPSCHHLRPERPCPSYGRTEPVTVHQGRGRVGVGGRLVVGGHGLPVHLHHAWLRVDDPVGLHGGREHARSYDGGLGLAGLGDGESLEARLAARALGFHCRGSSLLQVLGVGNLLGLGQDLLGALVVRLVVA